MDVLVWVGWISICVYQHEIIPPNPLPKKVDVVDFGNGWRTNMFFSFCGKQLGFWDPSFLRANGSRCGPTAIGKVAQKRVHVN